MALNFKRGSRARDGDIWEQSKSLVAVSGWTRLESGCLFQGRAAEMRLSGVRGKSQEESLVPPCGDDGRSEDRPSSKSAVRCALVW